MHRVIAGCLVFTTCLAACGPGIQSTPAAPPSSVANGDVNGDGVVDYKDMLLAQRIALGMVTPSADQLTRGDMRTDGLINVSDYLLIQKMVLGL
jgi:hypothetical protein